MPVQHQESEEFVEAKLGLHNVPNYRCSGKLGFVPFWESPGKGSSSAEENSQLGPASGSHSESFLDSF